MEEPTPKQLIYAKAEEYSRKWRQHKRELQNDLECYCVANGGHYWWPWQERVREMLFREDNHWIRERTCMTCRKCESERIEEK